MNDNQKQSKGLGFISILTLIFVVSKILNLITWSWWLVFSPILFVISLFVIILATAWVIDCFIKIRKKE